MVLYIVTIEFYRKLIYNDGEVYNNNSNNNNNNQNEWKYKVYGSTQMCRQNWSLKRKETKRKNKERF